MHIAFLNPQGNFDPEDRYWTAHPDFGGQLVYVKEVALALGAGGHRVDILTRRIVDPEWIGFEGPVDGYPGYPDVRILRLPCGPEGFLRKEDLWPHLHEWVDNIQAFYGDEGTVPQVWAGHYGDGGLAAAMLSEATGRPFTFTAHSLGAQKLDRLAGSADEVPGLDAAYRFARRLAAERCAMSCAGQIVVSTRMEQREQYAHPAYAGAVDASDDERFAVIPPGVNLRIFNRDAVSENEDATAVGIEAALSRDLNADRLEKPVVLASSRLEPKKNHVGLVRAYALSQELQATANLGIVVRGMGDPLREWPQATGETREVLGQVAELIEAHGLWDKVTAFPLEGQPELAAGYRHLARRRSVFCLPALYEPFGLAPLEAMAAGLPVVATCHGGPTESMREGEREFAVLADPADLAELAAALLRVIGSVGEWEHFREAGYRRVLDRYTWERTAEGYLGVFLGLAGKRAEEGLPIPAYFYEPSPANDPSIEELAAWISSPRDGRER